MSQFTQFTKWAVFCSEDLTNEVLSILEELTKCGSHFKYLTTSPECFFVEKDQIQEWNDGLTKQINPNFELLICFTRMSKAQLANEVLGFNVPFIVEKLPVKEKVDSSFAHALLQRIAAARNDHPWTILELSEPNPMVFGSFGIIKHEGEVFLTFVFSCNKLFTKYFQRVCKIDLQNTDEQVSEFLASCSSQFKTKVVNLDFFAVCYLLHESKNDPVVSQIKSSIGKNMKSFTTQPFVFLEICPVRELELYYVTTRSVQEKKILTYRSFQEFYSEKNKAFKYSPDCLILDESSGFDL